MLTARRSHRYFRANGKREARNLRGETLGECRNWACTVRRKSADVCSGREQAIRVRNKSDACQIKRPYGSGSLGSRVMTKKKTSQYIRILYECLVEVDQQTNLSQPDVNKIADLINDSIWATPSIKVVGTTSHYKISSDLRKRDEFGQLVKRETDKRQGKLFPETTGKKEESDPPAHDDQNILRKS